MDTLRNVFWIAVVAMAACLAFFFALGAIPTDATGLLVVLVVLAVLFAVHMWLQSRHHGPRDPRLVHDRERRGF